MRLPPTKVKFGQVVCTKFMADGIKWKWAHVSGKQRAFLWDPFCFVVYLSPKSQLRVYQVLPSSSQNIATLTKHRVLPLRIPTLSPNTAMLGIKLPTHELWRDTPYDPSTLAVTHITAINSHLYAGWEFPHYLSCLHSYSVWIMHTALLYPAICRRKRPPDSLYLTWFPEVPDTAHMKMTVSLKPPNFME